jgi:hypothetical protein
MGTHRPVSYPAGTHARQGFRPGLLPGGAFTGRDLAPLGLFPLGLVPL